MSERHSIELPDHEFLSQLVRQDPKRYEALRRELIEQLIDSAPERLRPRLRGMQFRIDLQHQSSRPPLGLTVSLYNHMWEAFLQLNDSLQHLSQSKPEDCQKIEKDVKRSAAILEFRRRHESTEWLSGGV